MSLVLQTEPMGQLGVAGREVDWLAEAESVAAGFLRHSHKAEDGSVLWLKPARPMDDEGRPRYLGPHLHAGYTGPALFLAAMSRVSSRSEYRELALGTLVPLRRMLSHLVANSDKAEQLELRLGAIVGLGGFVYTLARAASWLDEPELWEDASNAAALMTSGQLAADRSLDVMYGSAGAILALWVFENEAPEHCKQRIRPKDLAVACGEHLLERREGAPGEPRGWPIRMQPASAGFAHGAAGISYALTKLARWTGREDFSDAAAEGWRYERLHYVDEERNWTILRMRQKFMNAWCNGAPGIALGRFELADGDDPQVLEDLELALAKATDPETVATDHVCCGNFGRIDILLQGWRELRREDLLRVARRLALKAVRDARARRPPGFLCEYHDEEHFNPGFFKGIAGVGYTLLRLAEPTEWPCILALE